MTDARVVEAAGGLVWRPGPEILVVHRPRYDDWSLPKGKLHVGEHRLAAAVREVFEETGVCAAPQARLPTVRYLTGEPGVEKSVDYWAMRCLTDSGHQPDDEVDVAQWLPAPAAMDRLTYGHDRGVLTAFTELAPVTGVVVLVRHGSAGRRKGWPGADIDRPLDDAGRRDAGRAAELLPMFGPVRVLSAPVRRCRDTVGEAAARAGLPVQIDDRLAEGADPDAALELLRRVAAEVPAAVVCSQGGLMRPMLTRLLGPRQDQDTPKGTGWVLSYAADGALVAADQVDLRVAGV